MTLDQEIAAHRNRIIELKANILDARDELQREQDVLDTLLAVRDQEQPAEEPAAPRRRTAGG